MDRAPRIVVVEDEPALAAVIGDYFTRHGYEVRLCRDGIEGAEVIEASAPDLVVLDLTLPRLDGLEVCRRVRPRFRGAILMLTARVDAVDEILGLEIGADDYVRKPVEPRLLLARTRALLRRFELPDPRARRIELGHLVIDAGRREVFVDGVDVALTSAEFDLVWTLAAHAGRVVTREALHKELRGIPYDGLDRSIDLRVSRVRRKLGDVGGALIRSVRGTGYQLAGPS